MYGLKKHGIHESESHSVMCNALQTHGLYHPRNSPSQNTGVGSLYINRGSSQTRDRTQVSHIAADSLPAESLSVYMMCMCTYIYVYIYQRSDMTT